jgi:NADPH2:quinone reductase
MKAFQIFEAGPHAQLRCVEQAKPDLQAGQALVRVAAFGINRADLLQIMGRYPAPAGVPAHIPGMEFAGEVEALAAGYQGTLKPGMRVAGLVAGGAYAEYVAVAADCLLALPEAISWTQAAAIPEVYVTASDALRQLDLKNGESILIHAVGSGLGIAALQLAQALGCTVVGTSRSPEKLSALKQHGLRFTIDTSGGFLELGQRLKSLAPELQHGVSAILDVLGAAAFEQNLLALRQQGRMICLATLTGSSAALDISLLMRKRLTLVGSVLRSRALSEKIQAVQYFRRTFWPLLEQETIRPLVDRCFSVADLETALERLRTNQNLGKVVVSW